MIFGSARLSKMGKSVTIWLTVSLFVAMVVLVPSRMNILSSSYADEIGGTETREGCLFRGPSGVVAKIDENGNFFIKGHALQNVPSIGSGFKGSSNWEYKEAGNTKFLVVLSSDDHSSETGDIVLTGNIHTSASLTVQNSARFVFRNSNKIPIAIIKSDGDLLLRGFCFEGILYPEEMILSDNPYDLCNPFE